MDLRILSKLDLLLEKTDQMAASVSEVRHSLPALSVYNSPFTHSSSPSPPGSSALRTPAKRQKGGVDPCEDSNDPASQIGDAPPSRAAGGNDYAEQILLHKIRVSTLETLLSDLHFQTIYNMFVAGFLMSTLAIVVENLMETGLLVNLSLIQYVFADGVRGMYLWLGLFVYAHGFFFMQRAVNAGWFSQYWCCFVTVCCNVSLFTAYTTYLARLPLPPATGIAVMCELTRICMKTHGYVFIHSNMRRHALAVASASKRSNKAGDSAVVRQQLIPLYFGDIIYASSNLPDYDTRRSTLDAFEYYLWAPTLIYAPAYPRLDRIRWGKLFQHLMEVFLCVAYIWALFTRFCAPNMGETTGGYTELLRVVFKLMLPSYVILMVTFYMVLHSWQNMFAELLSFGDRAFYSDWWNSRNWGQYYRRWNIVVHKWLYRFLYLELTYAGHSSLTAMFATFLISAIIHELIVGVALQMFYPVLFTLFGVPGVLFIFLSKIGAGARFWNIFMWAMLMLGTGMMCALYGRGWGLANVVLNISKP